MVFVCILQDVTDLFGADLPVEGGKGGEFAWRDGPFLKALKAGHWIVLDEVNISKYMLHISSVTFSCHLFATKIPVFRNLVFHSSETYCCRFEMFFV